MLRIILVFIAVMASMLSRESSAAKSEIVLGQSAMVSGVAGELGSAYRDGALLFFDHVNRKGGVQGKRIRLITLDDAYDVKKAEENTRQLIEKENALALFGYMHTNTVRASLPIATKANVPFVAPFAGYDELFKTFNPVLFTTLPGFSSETDTLVRHIQAMGLKRVALMRYESPAGEAFEKEVEAKLRAVQIPLLGVGKMQMTADANMEQAVSTLAELRPAAIVVGVSGDFAAEFIKRFNAAAKLKPVQFLARSISDGRNLVKRLGPESRGVVITQLVPSPFTGKTRIGREYQTAVKAAQQQGQKIEASYTGFQGYIGAKVMVEGLRRAGQNPTRASVIAGLETMRHWDAGDFEVNFSPTNHNGSNFVTVTVIGAGGHFIE